MAEQGFARNVTSTIGVPQAPTTAPNPSSLGDVASIASFGLSLYSSHQQQKQQEQAAIKEEGLFEEARQLDTLKLNMQAQDLTSVQQNAKLQKRLSSYSAMDRSRILKISSETTGRTVKDAATAESAARNNRQKQILSDQDAAASSMGFLNYASMPEGKDDMIEKHLSEQFSLASKAREDTITLRQLDISAKTDANLDRKASIVSSSSISRINIGIRNGVRSGFADLQNQRLSGEITSDADLGKQYVDLLNRGMTDLDQQFSQSLKAEDDPLVRSKLESQYKNMREEYQSWADTMQDVGSGTRQQKRIQQQLTNIDADQKARIYAVEGMPRIINLVKLGIQDASTLNQLNIANSVIGDQVKSIGEALKDSADTSSPRTSTWSSFYTDQDQDNLKKTATATTKVSKDLMSGKIQIEGGPEFALDNTAIYMEEVINGQPAPNQFIKEVVSNFTDVVLDSSYDSMPEAQKKRIGDNAPDFARKFFGTNNTGSFVPSVNQMLLDSGLGTVLKSSSSNPLWSLGLNKSTGMLEVSLPSQKRILENLDSSGSGRGATGGSAREINKRLKAFKLNLETNSTIRKVLQATAKATGKDIELVTAIVLSDLSISSNIPVAEAYTTRPAEDGEETTPAVVEPTQPTIDFSGMTREEAEELMRLQLEETFGK